MKWKIWLAGLVLGLAGCATNLLGKEVQALQAVTATRTAATAALRAGKITVAKDQEIQKWADVTRASIEAAVAAGNAAVLAAAQADAEAKKTELEAK